jgi:hypothetical protein
MKKIGIILSLVILVGCTCLGQVPEKLMIGDTITCTVLIPDITPYVNADANCSEVVSIYQTPDPGTPITTETILTVFAVTDQGVESSKDILIIPIFTDSARITIDAAFFAYEDNEVFDMFRVIYAWSYNYPQRYLNAMQNELSWMNWRNVDIENYGRIHFADVPMNDTMIREDLQAGYWRLTFLQK